MKVFLEYIKNRKKELIAVVFSCLMLLLVFYLYSLQLDAYWFVLELVAVCILIGSAYDYYRFYKKYTALQHLINCEEINDLADIQAFSGLEADYVKLAVKILNEKRKLREEQTAKLTDMKDYYAMWAHQIKTPIAAMNLILQVGEKNPENLDVRSLKREAFKIDFYADSAMNYLRLEDMSTDFAFKEIDVERLVKTAVKKFASQFIGKKISITIDEMDYVVCSDEKWYGFIVEQLLSNAVKYTNAGGNVHIYKKRYNDSNALVIEDSGIGIAPEDIPRITERGFTGYNGRIGSKSSGIGLYLCKKAADKLGAKLVIESKLRVGTKVSIIIKQTTTVHE